MVFVEPSSWAGTALLIAISSLSIISAGFSARRWGWKGLLLLPVAAVLMPVLLTATVGAIWYYVGIRDGDAGGFAVHLGELIYLLAIPFALMGFGGGMLSRRFSRLA